MKKYHVISAKRLGYNNGDRTYAYFFFPADAFTEEQALGQFNKVQKMTLKANCHWYPYTAYEYGGEIFYSIQYSGLADEDEIR